MTDTSTRQGDRYEVLHYRGDVTYSATVGALLGFDEFGRQYEVLDAEVDLVEAPGHYDGDGCTFPAAGHLERRTTVHLQYATLETLRAAAGATQ